MPLLEAYALGQMATFMLVIHWISFVYATYIGSEMYYDATGIGCIAFMAVLSAFKSGTFFPRQVWNFAWGVGGWVCTCWPLRRVCGSPVRARGTEWCVRSS